MTKFLAAAVLAAGAVSLSGCASAGVTGKDVLAHIETCKRHYTGTFGATGVTGSVDVQCDPVQGAGVVSTSPAASPAPVTTPSTTASP